MHTVIRAIVYAQNKDEALQNAKNVFEGLCENQNPFDYYQTFDTEGTPVSGRGRWGNITPVAKADSVKGKKLINEGMEATKREFFRNIKIIRTALQKKTNTQLFKSDYDKEMFRYRCRCIGEYKGSNIWLYDNDGEGIRTPRHLKDALNKWTSLYEKNKNNPKDNPFKDFDVYVVSADTHH